MQPIAGTVTAAAPTRSQTSMPEGSDDELVRPTTRPVSSMIATAAADATKACDPSQRHRDTGRASTTAPRVATSSVRAAPRAVAVYVPVVIARNTVYSASAPPTA